MQLEFTPAGGVRVLKPASLVMKQLHCTIELASFTEPAGGGQWNPENGPEPRQPKLLDEAASYEDETDATIRLRQFLSGFQHKLDVAAGAVAMPVAAVSPETCKLQEALGGAGAGKVTVATYLGAMPLETIGGDLGIEE